MKEEDNMNLSQSLLDWYDKNKRDLPWRDQGNAYYTWISEIMLQQTRVEAVKPYFLRFTRELPTVWDLAACEEERLLKLWEGLGYYSRARNLKEAAIDICERYCGELPRSYDELLSLKGVGPYTAGAIASIAYGIPVPAVDGNVYRIFTRLQADQGDITDPEVKKRVASLVLAAMPQGRPGDFNQALMDLGALVCLPGSAPACDRCPVQDWCLAYKAGNPSDYPVKAAKKPRRIEDRTILVIQDGEESLIKKRPAKGLLAGLYEPYNVPGHLSAQEVKKAVEALGLEPLQVVPLPESKHIFSHIEWHMQAYQVRVSSLGEPADGFVFANRESFQKDVPVPSAFAAYRTYLGAADKRGRKKQSNTIESNEESNV